MDRSPKILVVADEPMFIVDMLSELEGRGFAIEPMTPGEHENWSQPHGIDAAVFDLHQPDEISLQFASMLRRSGIPIVALGGGSSGNSARIAGAENCLSRPVDYDGLADILCGLVSRPLPIATHASAGAFQLSDGMTADKR